MCGRYTVKTSAKKLQEEFSLRAEPALSPRYNVAPTQDAPILMMPGELRMAHWGLVPPWATDVSVGTRMINARSESLDSKPAFKDAFAHRRCLVIADGFYEWQKVSKSRQPYYIHLASNRPFTFGGIWERWKSPEGKTLISFSIVTTPSNEAVSRLHNRMPLFIPAQARSQWLSSTTDLQTIKALLKPGAPEALDLTPVETYVNSVAFDDERCLTPAKQFQMSLL